MEHAYAQALWKMVEGGMEAKKAVHALRDILVARGREVLFPRIAKAFERLAAREMARTQLTLHVARESDERRARKECNEVLKQLKLDTDITVKVDEHLIGGWRLEGNEHLVDASYKKHLLTLYNRATHA